MIVGLPGAGKSTRARELEKAHRALRFSPDEWMIPPFGESEADGKRDLLEGLLINAGLCALAGTNVVLDFGFWGRDERRALRSLDPIANRCRPNRVYCNVNATKSARTAVIQSPGGRISPVTPCKLRNRSFS